MVKYEVSLVRSCTGCLGEGDDKVPGDSLVLKPLLQDWNRL